MDKESPASPSEMETRVRVTGYVELEAHEGPVEDGPLVLSRASSQSARLLTTHCNHTLVEWRSLQEELPPGSLAEERSLPHPRPH